jgi:hypothetical protein
MRDYLENTPQNREAKTTEVFGNYENFVKAIKETFGDPDEERTPERELTQLKQRGSAWE